MSFGETPAERFALATHGEQPSDVIGGYVNRAVEAGLVSGLLGGIEQVMPAIAGTVVPGYLSTARTVNRKAGTAFTLNQVAREAEDYEDVDLAEVAEVAKTIGTPREVEAVEKEIGAPLDISSRQTEALGIGTRERPTTALGRFWDWVTAEHESFEARQRAGEPPDQPALEPSAGPRPSPPDQPALEPSAGPVSSPPDEPALEPSGGPVSSPPDLGWDEGDIGGSGTGDRDGDGTVLCTALYNMGGLPEKIYRADSEYASKHIDTDVYIGYACWAKHLARRRWVVILLSSFIRAWAYHMAFKMDRTDKRNRLGEFLELIGIPLCRSIWRLRNGITSSSRLSAQ